MAWTTAFLLLFPTAFFFSAVYTEGLFFMLMSMSLYFFYSKKKNGAAVSGFLLALTRLIGVFVSIPFITEAIYKKGKLNFSQIKWPLVIIAPFIGLGLYMVYLFATTGDPLYFFTAQPSFGANRSTHLILLPQVYYRYIKIFLILLGISLFSLINIVLPTLTGTLSSIPRYALMSWASFMYLGNLKNYYAKISIALIFFIFQIIVASYFIQGYFVG
jgi:hypothetical protein